MTAHIASQSSFSALDLLRKNGLKLDVCIVVDNAKMPSKDMVEYALGMRAFQESTEKFLCCSSSTTSVTGSMSFSNSTSDFDASISESYGSSSTVAGSSSGSYLEMSLSSASDGASGSSSLLSGSDLEMSVSESQCSSSALAGSSSLLTDNNDFDMSIGDLDTIEEKLRWEEPPMAPLQPQEHPVCPQRLLSPTPVRQGRKTIQQQEHKQSNMNSRRRLQSVLKPLPTGTDSTSFPSSQATLCPNGNITEYLDKAMALADDSEFNDLCPRTIASIGS